AVLLAQLARRASAGAPAEAAAVPHALVTRTSYVPASAAATDAIEYVAPVAPAITFPFFRHCRPPALPVTESDAGCPADTVCAAGTTANGDEHVYAVSGTLSIRTPAAPGATTAAPH